MKVCTCFLLFGIFANTNSILRIRPKGDHRVGIHLPQETVMEYSNEESSGDSNNLYNVNNIITRGTTAQDKNMKLVFRAPGVETLTDFIQEAVTILNTYEDTAFEDFFHILDNEIRKYHYRGCKFSELTQNPDTRGLLAGSFKLIRGKPVSFTKANINEVADIISDETYDRNVKELLDYINTLYINTKPNFHSVLNELKHYRKTKSMKTHNDLVQVIRAGVRAILFDHYTKFNTNTRRELKERIETFWKNFKNNPASKAEMNDIPYKDPVIKSLVNNIKQLKHPETYSKNDPQMKLKNKSERIVSIEAHNEQFQNEETEMNENSNEFWEPATNYATNEISSGQSLDSSSNSIKNSQERHEEYNTQRYITLYTEEISYKAKTTDKTEIIPISANVITRSPEIKMRPMTTSTPRESHFASDRTEKIEILRANYDTDDTKLDISNSSLDTESSLTLESKYEPRAKQNYDKPPKHGKADESRSESKQKNVEIISQYDAVINVQLANSKLLKSLRMSEPLGMETKYDTTLYPRSAIQTEPVPTKSTITPRSMRAQAEIKLQKPTAPTKPRSRYSKDFYRKQFSDLRKNIAPPSSNEGHPVDQFMKDKNHNQKYLRRSDNDTIRAEDFNTYVIKRINAIENELNELKQMNDFSFISRINDNNTSEVRARNFTDTFEVKDKVDSKRKDMKGNIIDRLLKEDHDLNNEEVNDGHEFTTRNNTINVESSTINTKSRKLSVIKKNIVNVTVIDNKNTTQVTNNTSKVNVNVTKKLNKEVINNNFTTSTVGLVKVTNISKLESVVTTPTFGITRRTMSYSEPSYYDTLVPTVRNSEFDPFFDHVNDGFDLHM